MIDVVIPVLDEAEALPWVLARVPIGFRVIVVDNGSTDDSASIARRHGADVVTEPRRGFGAACWAGLQQATSDIVCFMDGDASLDPADLRNVVEPVDAGAAELVLGARCAEPGAWPAHARFANRVLSWRLRCRGIGLRDLGPMRAAPRGALIELGLEDRASGWPLEMVLRADRAGWRITEVDVPYLARRGRSKVTGTVRGSANATVDMLRWMRSVR